MTCADVWSALIGCLCVELAAHHDTAAAVVGVGMGAQGETSFWKDVLGATVGAGPKVRRGVEQEVPRGGAVLRKRWANEARQAK